MRSNHLRLAILILSAFSLNTFSSLSGATLNFRQFRIPVTGPIHDMVVVELNSDGFPNIALIDNYDKKIRTFLGDANQTYALQFVKDYSKLGKIFIGATDFNGDKKPDLAVDSAWSKTYFAIFPGKGNGELLNTDMVYFFKSNGDGTFKLSKKTKVGSIGTFLACGDLNGDKKLDLVGDANYWNDGWSMIRKGDGRFTRKKLLGGVSGMGGGAVLVDLTGDKKLDLASGETSAITISFAVTRFPHPAKAKIDHS
jgi:hypothetical protein